MINWFEKFLLRRLIRHSCPDRYSLTSKRAHCYEICLKSSKNEYLLYVKEMNSKGFSGTHWDNQYSESYRASVPFSFMDDLSVEIKTFIDLQEFTYPSVFKCVLDDWTCCNRIPIFRDAIDQFFYNQKNLALKERTDVLKILIERYIKNPDITFDKFKLVEIIHGQRWNNHPDRDAQLDHARIILDSLEESGEIRQNGKLFTYELTGKALITLETYEREENRHNQIKNLTCALVIVGIIQAFVGFIQAYIAYIPNRNHKNILGIILNYFL